MANTEAQPKSIIEKEWAPIDSGMKYIGRLVTASAVLKIIVRGFELSLFTICKAILSSYTKVFHPLVQYTIGLIPKIFGYDLLPITKDFVVLYSIGCAVAARSFVGMATFRRLELGLPRSREGKVWAMVSGLIWPLMLVAIISRWRAAKRGRSGFHFRKVDIQYHRRVIKKTLSNVRKEIVIVSATVAAFLLLNAAKA